MGADLIIASLVVDHQAALDFSAGLAAIERLSARDIEDPDYFDDDPETPEGIVAIRGRLSAELRELELGLAHSREVEWIEVRGALVYLTGGMSYGEPPTELIETIDRLRAARGILHAVGFERESRP